MNIKKLYNLTYVAVGLFLSFSFLTLSFNADISLLAFPLCLSFTVAVGFFALKRVFIEKRVEYLKVYRILFQYAPYVLLIGFILKRAGEYGTPYFIDLISVILWCVAFVIGYIILHYLNPKRVAKVSSEWANILSKKNKSDGFSIKKIGLEILSWIDALVQAVFMVLLINIFIVQLYEIPSESMVPEFLIRDRVIVFKTLSGPKFPLSDVGLPYIRSYDRGDIVVFRNPHYENDRKSEVKTVVSQIVYMCSLTNINLNVDDKGNPIADPLVKRVCGVPGEQLMMQDGVLYARTKDSPAFKAIEQDNSWACWNLCDVRSDLISGIQDFVFDQGYYDNMLKIEEERRNLNLDEAKFQMQNIVRQMKNYNSMNKQFLSDFNMNLGVVPAWNMGVHGFYQLLDIDDPCYDPKTLAIMLCNDILHNKNALKWFEDFMMSPFEMQIDFGEDIYSEANLKLNVMTKLNIANMVLKVAKNEDTSILEDQARIILDYILFLDLRNMPIFPSNKEDGSPSYIPEGNYFMMGDNRFNSLDMRHSYERKMLPITGGDRNSINYVSDIDPQYVPKSKMLGSTSYRFWPFSRSGVPGHTGK